MTYALLMRPALSPLLVAALLAAAAHPVEAAAEPSSAAERMYSHTAAPGDTLLGLASRYLNKVSDWPAVAKLNNIADPRRIPVGTAVRIPVSLMRREAAPVVITAVSGQVDVGTVPAVANANVKEGDAIRTGDDGFVTLRLADGSTLTLQSRSALKVKTARQLANTGGIADTQMRLDSGRLETRVARQRGPSARYEIETPTSNLGVRGTIFRAASDGGSRSQTEVTEGRVAAASSDPKFAKEVGVDAGFGSLVEAGKPPSPPIALLPAPVVGKLEPAYERADVTVTFSAVDKAVAYRGQVALDEAFSQLVADARSNTAEAPFGNLPDGELYLRVRGIDAQGLEGKDAVGRLTVKARPFPPTPIAPAPGARVAVANPALAWKSAGEVSTHRVQLAQDAQFANPVLDKTLVAASEIRPDAALSPGKWFWRLSSIAKDGKKGPWSGVRTFEVAPPQVRLIAYPQQGGVQIGIGDEKRAYQVQAARDSRFLAIVADRMVEGRVDFADLPVNAYYVRVRLRDAGGDGEWSPAAILEVYPKGWWLSQPAAEK